MKHFTSPKVVYFEDEDFDANGNIKLPIPTIVMLQAKWCGHCTTMKPVYQQFADESKGDVLIGTVESDGERPGEKALGKRIEKIHPGLKGFPTVIAFKDGRVLQEYSGPRTKEGLEEWKQKMFGYADKKWTPYVN